MTFMSKDIAELFEVTPGNFKGWRGKVPKRCLKRMATVDHIYTKADYRRFLPIAPGEETTRLACKGCNESRGAKIIGGQQQFSRKLPALGVLLEVI